MSIKNFVGIPFRDQGADFRGVDCYGLVKLYYRFALDINLPMVSYQSAKDHQRNAYLIDDYCREEKVWTEATSRNRRQNSVILFKINGYISHCGIYLAPKLFLHALEGIGSALESLDDPVWQKRIEGYYYCTLPCGYIPVNRDR